MPGGKERGFLISGVRLTDFAVLSRSSYAFSTAPKAQTIPARDSAPGIPTIQTGTGPKARPHPVLPNGEWRGPSALKKYRYRSSPGRCPGLVWGRACGPPEFRHRIQVPVVDTKPVSRTPLIFNQGRPADCFTGSPGVNIQGGGAPGNGLRRGAGGDTRGACAPRNPCASGIS